MKQFISKIVNRNNLTFDEAYNAAITLLKKDNDPVDVTALLVGLRVKGESPEELAGFTKALKDTCVKVSLKTYAIDTAGTGGDEQNTFNVSTAAALVAAASGAKVLKHGNRAVSSSSGSADFLEALGFNINLSPEALADMVERHGFAFAFAPKYHPTMANVMPIRKRLGIRTIFNFIGPLANPGNIKRQIIGVASPEFMKPLSEAISLLNLEHVMLVHGVPGIDEVSVFGITRVIEIKKDSIESYKLLPSDLGLSLVQIDKVRVSSPHESVEKVLESLKYPNLNNDIINFIAANAGFALYVAGIGKDLKDSVEIALETILSKRAYEYVKYIIEVSKQYGG
jgi:anthranilate phosphoribosyltransferase